LQKHKIVIIGAGFAGICIAIKLKTQGIDDFVIFEKADRLGGTWRDNTYPGAECDIPSALYSFSFEHNADWEYKWSGQEQILKYQQDVASKHQLQQFIQYQTEVCAAQYDQAENAWRLTMRNGDQCWAQHLVTAVGQLHYPSTPKIAGADNYQGALFHSAQWDHQVELQDKRVAVIGNAASAVQLIPEIAKKAQHLSIFQRSANWMIPKVDRPYTRFEQWLSKKFPPIAKIYRFGIWMSGEYGVLPAIRGKRFSRWLLRGWSRRHLHRQIKDSLLLEKLTPDYPIGAKRILFSDNYYPTLNRDNVTLVTDNIESFSNLGLVLANGDSKEFDVIIYATGFKTNPFLSSIKITGTDEQLLSDAWRDGAHAYLGIATHGFPNLHMMYGPNTNLGHSSIIIMLEAQANYIVQSIAELDRQSHQSIEVNEATEQQYNKELQLRLQKMAFNEIAESWYKDGGKITNNWAGSTLEYMRRTKNVDWAAYTLT